MPPLPFQSLSANLSAENGKPITLPASPSWQTGAIMPAARVYCEKLLAGETVELVFASVALNPRTGSGPTLRLPDKLIAPRQDPKRFIAAGTVETGQVDGSKRYAIRYSEELRR
jgi:hypothetical protein